MPMCELHACMSDDVELYGLKAKSNQFKTLRQVDDSILDELDDVEVEKVNVNFIY
jgi:phosphoglycerate-specific signal transduction histidine kinase